MPLYMYGATFLRVVRWVGSMAEQSRLNGIWRKKRIPLDLGGRFRVGLGKFGCFIQWGDGWVAKPHKKNIQHDGGGSTGLRTGEIAWEGWNSSLHYAFVDCK